MSRRPAPPVLRSPVLFLAVLALPLMACGPGGSVYVGVSAPGPWVSYPGSYYPGYYGYPGYRWEEEDAPDLDWTPPWVDEAETSASPDPTRVEPVAEDAAPGARGPEGAAPVSGL
ncbi:MAG: hypothetical protein P8188_14365 [Gemmatimonadota bacterium]|jgi:hypothetical protein